MALQIFLNWHTVNFGFRRKVMTAEKQREHRTCAQLRIIGRPDHAWERVAVYLMADSCAGCVEFSQIHADSFQRPTGSAIATCPATPYILVWINEHADVIARRFF